MDASSTESQLRESKTMHDNEARSQKTLKRNMANDFAGRRLRRDSWLLPHTLSLALLAQPRRVLLPRLAPSMKLSTVGCSL